MGVRWRILRLMRGDGVTFGGVGGFVFAPVAEDFVFDPRHVGVVVGIVLFLCPLHDLLLAWNSASGDPVIQSALDERAFVGIGG